MIQKLPVRPVAVSLAGFCFCPAVVLQQIRPEQWAFVHAVYERAFAEALAIVRPSLPERDLLGVWN